MKKAVYLIKRIFGTSISKKIIFTVALLILVSVFLVGYSSFSVAKSSIESKTRKYIEDILSQITKNIEMRLSKISDIAVYIQTNPVIQTYLKQSSEKKDDYQKLQIKESIQNTLFRSVLYNDEIEAVTIVSQSGDVFEINKTLQKHPIGMVSKEEIYHEKGSQVWLESDKDTKTFIVAAAINSLNTQKPLGYLILNVKEDYISDIFSQLELGNIFIMDKSNIIISHNDKSLLQTQVTKKYIQRVVENRKNDFFSYEIDDTKNYIAYNTIDISNWYVIALIPDIINSRTLFLIRTTILIIGLLVAAGGILATVFITNRMSRPIKKLTLAMQQFGEGELYTNCSINSSDEIGQLSDNFNNMVRNINDLIRRLYEEKLLKQQAELKSLRMQINPHFFYNTLETINWMSRINGVSDIGIVAKALGDLMRLTISGSDFITIEDELKIIGNYLKIQNYRYGDKLSVYIDVDYKLHEMCIPKLIIQPILENSITHGIEKKTGNGFVEILGRLEDNIVVLTISDNGIGISQERMKSIFKGGSDIIEEEHTHIGINNVDKRLKLYYGEQYGISVYSNEGIGTKITIRFPGMKVPPDNKENVTSFN